MNQERITNCNILAKLPQDRSEHDQRELARLKRYKDGRSDAAPVIQYERCD